MIVIVKKLLRAVGNSSLRQVIHGNNNPRSAGDCSTGEALGPSDGSVVIPAIAMRIMMVKMGYYN